ncbi:MAG TPA: hypothetical protein VFH45_13210 [Acidimicrobiales bacterium]|nr:hypothetical protein [Acidimicrobiales bacterium]
MVPGLSHLFRKAVGAGLGGVFSGAGGAVAAWAAQAAAFMIGRLAAALKPGGPQLGAQWYSPHYDTMLVIAGAAVVPVVALAAVQALLRQDPALLLRAVVVQLPLAGLLTATAVLAVTKASEAVDWMCLVLQQAPGKDHGTGQLLAGVARTAGRFASPVPGVPTLAVFLVSCLLAVGALVVWIELILRSAAVELAVLFLPLALAVSVWPAALGWARRLAETIAALLLAKFVVVGALTLAQGVASDQQFDGLVAALALVLLSALAPLALLRFIGLAELGTAHHVEGLAARAVRAPASAAQLVVAHGAGRGLPSAGEDVVGGLTTSTPFAMSDLLAATVASRRAASDAGGDAGG